MSKPSVPLTHPPRQHSLVFLFDDCKASRDRLSGAIRFLSTRNDLTLTVIDNRRFELRRINEAVRQADGLIIDSVRAGVKLPTGTPAIFFEAHRISHLTFAGCVQCDNRAIAAAAADLLRRRGHSQFAYIGTSLVSEQYHSQERHAGFSQRLGEYGYSVRSFIIGRQRQSALANFLKALPKPCGVLVYSDFFAQEVHNCCRNLGINIPDQINLVGVDNDTVICESLRPTLTSIHPNFEQGGFAAIRMLVDCLEHAGGRQPRESYGVLRIVERDSTMDTRGSQRLTTMVRNYMSLHFTEPLRVGELARLFRTSRRRLEMRFREIVGHSLHDELEMLRLEEAQRLLANTTNSVTAIATACGYASANAFRNAFKSHLKATPLVWRKAHCGAQ